LDYISIYVHNIIYSIRNASIRTLRLLIFLLINEMSL
jgi:hypothetical protein